MAVELYKRGYTKAYTIEGGWNGWVKANFPTEQKEVTSAKNCVLCHTAMTPGFVADW